MVAHFQLRGADFLPSICDRSGRPWGRSLTPKHYLAATPWLRDQVRGEPLALYASFFGS